MSEAFKKQLLEHGFVILNITNPTITKNINNKTESTSVLTISHTQGVADSKFVNIDGFVNTGSVGAGISGGKLVTTPAMHLFYQPQTGISSKFNPAITTMGGLRVDTNIRVQDLPGYQSQAAHGVVEINWHKIYQSAANTASATKCGIDSISSDYYEALNSDWSLIDPNSGILECNNGISQSVSPNIGEDGTLYAVYDTSVLNYQIGKFNGSATQYNPQTYNNKPYFNMIGIVLPSDMPTGDYDFQFTINYSF